MIGRFKRIFLTIKKTLPLISALSLLKIGCAGEPDFAEAPGVCALNCTDTKLPANDMRIRFLLPQGITVSDPLPLACFDVVNADYVNEVPIRFVVEKRRSILPAEQDGPIDVVIGGERPDFANDANAWVPVSGIAFQPLLLAGIMDPLNPANQALDRYKGIVTPETEWCTDACGVGSLEVRPRCLANATNAVQVGIISGSLYGIANLEVVHPF
ncbi:MAG: hypothetical protein HRU09_01415 [Oligoflexales bacterium]|nr:hypothetical protein [Oligoflexales bacterium]